MDFKFELKEIVSIDGVICEVRERELYENAPDFLVYPLGRFQGFTKPGGHELPGWVRTEHIKKIEK